MTEGSPGSRFRGKIMLFVQPVIGFTSDRIGRSHWPGHCAVHARDRQQADAQRYPGASNAFEARELLRETYDHIKQSVEELDTGIDGLKERTGVLETRKQVLIDRHPELE